LLIDCSIESYYEQAVGILQCQPLLSKSLNSTITSHVGQSDVLGNENYYRIVIERELPLQCGSPVEIHDSQFELTAFDYHNALNAILVRGCLSGKIEYWDQNGFLKLESIEIDFWRFIKAVAPIQETSNLFAVVETCSFTPINRLNFKKRIMARIQLNCSELGRREIF